MKNIKMITLRLISVVMITVLTVGMSAVIIDAEAATDKNEINAVYNYKDENSYALYKEKHSGEKYGETDIVLQGGNELYKDNNGKEYKNIAYLNTKSHSISKKHQ